MFVSQCRLIVYPQFEHARLTGTIAQHWAFRTSGDPIYPRCVLCRFALHDLSYGLLDTQDILGMDATERRRTFKSLVQRHLDDSIVEIVAKTQLERLMHMSGLSEFETNRLLELKGLIARSRILKSVLRNADTKTRLCDSVAFDFCFEQATTVGLAVLANQVLSNRVDVRYEIDFWCNDLSDSKEGVLSKIQRARHTNAWTIENVCVDHGG